MPNLPESLQKMAEELSKLQTQIVEMQIAEKVAEQEKAVMQAKIVELEVNLALIQEKAAKEEQEKNAEIAELPEKLKTEEANIASNKAIEELQIKLASIEKVAEVKEEELITKPAPKTKKSIDKSADSSTTETKEAAAKITTV